MNNQEIKDLKEELRKKSFKVKPILLELQNYSFFHSVQNEDTDDINNRFLGRKKIINRLRSFIYDTGKNTGTYLVSGFRGMGKTSTVNRALSSLNVKSKLEDYILLWIFLLPITIFLEDIIIILSKYLENILFWSITFLFYLVTIFYLGHRDPRRTNTKLTGKKDVFFSRINYGFISFLNPKFQKHKYTFHKWLRVIVLYITSFLFLTTFYFFNIHEFDNHKQFEFFWFITYVIPICYILIDTYESLIKFHKKAGTYNSKWIISRVSTICCLIYIFILILFANYLSATINMKEISLIKISVIILLMYVVLKSRLKYKTKNKSKFSYNSTLNRVTDFFNLQHYVLIKVNLGKDNLTEKDVLKYITNELFNEYRKWYYNIKSLKRFSNITLILFIIYITSSLSYKTLLGKNFEEFTVNEFKIAYFFPSQALLTIEDSLISKNIDSFFKTKDSNSSAITEYNSKINTLLLKSNKRVGYENLGKKKNIIEEKKILDNKNKIIKTENRIQNQTFLNLTLERLGMLCNELDYLTLRLWHKTRKILIGNTQENIFLSIVYPRIPVLTIFLLTLILIISYRFIPNRLLLVKTHYYLLRELKKLKNEIDTSIIIEKGGSSGNLKNSFFSYLKRTSHAPLESKDITQRLIHILDDIAKINVIFTKIRLIFVFDELDKISTSDSTVISGLEDEFDNENNEVRYQTRRKERIGSILSSMKHFLNSAHAKFIFIAGREMYDAALAGISDRESNLDSIFNDNKIYVNSFYTEGDDKSLKDITSTTEQYLCQFLIPPYYLTENNDEEASISLYNKYLKDKGKKGDSERKKIIATLKDFVVYLTYRSNGAPRKLSSLLEQYIKPVLPNEISGTEASKNIIVGSNSENLFLELGYYHQYKFNFLSYLTSPIFIGLGNYIYEYSDKLLVSISYILDHLFKHHKFGLSYRGLSLTPEIVDINKEPQFREFLEKLISFLSKNHLRPIVSGIYDFKFHGKIQAEIKFLSKIDELEAAAFNFTLDESIELKRHFNKRLESLKSKEAQVIINNKNGYVEDYVNNISMLHMMIGDLHFYDEEFHEAIVHYMDALQILRQKQVVNMTLYEFIVFVRNNLKLGLAFEKNKMYDSALMTFSELTDLIIEKRYIPLQKFGLARFIVKESDLFHWSEHFDLDTIIELKNMFTTRDEVIVIGRLKEHIIKVYENNNGGWEKLYHIKDMATFYNTKGSDIIKGIDTIGINHMPIKTFYAQSTGESIRVLYQSLVAKLHLIEKTSPDRLKSIDIIRTIKEFNFLKFPLKTAEKRVIVAEFYNKMGDLLYFKNGTLNRCLRINLFNKIDTVADESFTKASKILLTSPIDATLFYVKSLATLLIPRQRIYKGKERNEDIINLIKYYECKDILSLNNLFLIVNKNLKAIHEKIKILIEKDSFKERYTNDFLFSIASGILDLCECLLNFTNYSKHINNYSSNNEIIDPHSIGSFLKISISEVLDLYHYASVIFEKTGEYRLARSQKIKILYILNQCTSKTLNEIIDGSLQCLNKGKNKKEKGLSWVKYGYEKGEKHPFKLEGFIEHCNWLSYFTKNNSGIIDNNKTHRIMHNPEEDTSEFSIENMEYLETEIVLQHLVNKFLNLKDADENMDLDLQEKVLANFFLATRNELQANLKLFIEQRITPFNIVGGRSNRLLILSTLVQYYKKNIMENPRENMGSNNPSIEFIVLNSIGACNEIIKIHNLFSLNYVTTSNYSLAKAHYQMAYWCDKLDKLEYEKSVIDELKKEVLSDVLDSKTSDYLDHIYHYKLALEYNDKIIDFHTRGASLQNFISSYSYLDDFYNDNFIHFSIAIERNQYLEGNIERMRGKIIEKINNC